MEPPKICISFLFLCYLKMVNCETFEILTKECVIPADSTNSLKNNWAVLVAGSRGYENYRHQADISHSYQVLLQNGISRDHIIVMMYDDIANHEMNPTKGVLVNEPRGANVYEGVHIDYTGRNVTPENFLHILRGDADAMKNIGSGRVIPKGDKNHIFWFFSGHGGTGVLFFPHDVLTVNDLISSLREIANRKDYKKMVFFIEACQSGSMFDLVLKENLDVFVMTAADPYESSYACYWDGSRQAYVADLFSAIWMDEASRKGIGEKSLHAIFKKVRTQTRKSHVEEYGNLNLGTTRVADVIGSQIHQYENLSREQVFIEDAIPSDHVPFAMLYKKLQASPENAESINKEVDEANTRREYITRFMQNMSLVLVEYNTSKLTDLYDSKFVIDENNMKCVSNVLNTFNSHCLEMSENSYTKKFTQIFINACSISWLSESNVTKQIESSCLKLEKVGRII